MLAQVASSKCHLGLSESLWAMSHQRRYSVFELVALYTAKKLCLKFSQNQLKSQVQFVWATENVQGDKNQLDFS